MATPQGKSPVRGLRKPPTGRPPNLVLRAPNGRHELVQAQVPSSVNRIWQCPRSPHSPSYALKAINSEVISVPVIDLSGLNDPAARLRIMNDLVLAASEWGCFQLINHGISKQTQQDMLRVAQEFFAMTDFKKRSFSKSEFHHGFGQSYRTVTGTMNWREVFRHEVAPVKQDEVAEWPCQPEDYSKVALVYGNEITKVSRALLELLSEGLGLKSGYIEEAMGGAITARMLLNNYPSCSEIEHAYGLPSHTNPNTLTFVIQDEVGGLEAFHAGEWLSVRCLPNSLTVDVSDHLHILSNGRYKSIPHRVVINPRATRISVAVFVAPAQNSWLKVAPEIVTEKEPAKFKKITFKGYLGEYYKQGSDQTAMFDQVLKIPSFPDSVISTTPRLKFATASQTAARPEKPSKGMNEGGKPHIQNSCRRELRVPKTSTVGKLL